MSRCLQSNFDNCYLFCNKCSSTQVLSLFFCPFQGQPGDVTDQLENDTISQSPPKTSRRSAGREKQVLQKVKLLAVPNATSSIIRSLFQTNSMATKNFFPLIHQIDKCGFLQHSYSGRWQHWWFGGAETWPKVNFARDLWVFSSDVSLPT